MSDARSAPFHGFRLLAACAAAGLVLLGFHQAVALDPQQKGLEFMPDMARSPAVESQTLAPQLPGGISHQPLVPGVVVRGRQPFRYAATPEDAERAGRELKSPFQVATGADLERGALVYSVHCVSCHGADGAGRGPAVERGMLPPPALGSATAVGLPDGAIYHLVTLGRGNMAALGARIEPDDRWRAILHVRRLQTGGQR